MPQQPAAGAGRDERFLATLSAASDRQIPSVLATYGADLVACSPRSAARSIRRLAAAYLWPQSRYARDAALIEPMLGLAGALAAAQHDDGTFDQGNLHSPPDSSFTLQDLCLVSALLAADAQPALAPLAAGLERIIRKAAPALIAGGVHTPNHRWELCAAIARIHQLWPQPGAIERIDEWLAEGVDIDPDGQYSERSANYAGGVTNPGLLTIARLCGRPELVEHVRRNLEATIALLEPNGEVETVHSRRQDQAYPRPIWPYLLQYRELALLDGNGQFASVARMIEREQADELGDFLACLIERPELARPLPAEEALPEQYTRALPHSGLARIRRGRTTATIFGGGDYHAIGAIASGLSTNPTFLKLRKGAAILESVRLAPQFFSTGHFRSAGLESLGEAYRLQSVVSAAYHMPLPAAQRRGDGAYPLTNDGRFFSQMDFPSRPKQLLTLRTELLITPAEGGFDISIALSESAAPFTIELCFRRGGELTGVVPLDAPESYQLIEGSGAYTVGEDRIAFGPGIAPSPAQPAVMDSGERYAWMGGGLAADGVRVLITGRSPIQYLLRLR